MAGQDIKKRLDPGGAQPVNVSGDYIFLKFADRPVDVIINGGRSGQTRVTMEAGDKYRPGPFEQFEIENTDRDRPAQIIVTVGEGDYNRQIVQGEISVDPILRNADGTTKPDTRHTLRIDVAPSNLALTSYQRGDLVRTWTPPTRFDGSQFSFSNNQYAFKGPGGLFTVYGLDTTGSGGARHRFFQYDKNMNLVNEFNYPRDTAFTPFCWTYRPGSGFEYVAQSGSVDVMNRLNPDGSVTGLKNFGNTGTFRRPFWSPELNLYLSANNGRVNAMSASRGDVYELFAANSAEGPTAYDPLTKEVQIAYFSSLRCYDLEGNLTRSIPSNAGGDWLSGFSTVNEFSNQAFVGKSPNVAALVALEDFTTKPEFIARRSDCELASGFYRPDNIPQVTASVTAEQLHNGVVLSGEIIRAALEYYYRRIVPDGYLDHVYALDISAAGSGAPFPQIVTGNETFARAGIADNFDFLAPGQVVITLDNELELGAPL